MSTPTGDDAAAGEPLALARALASRGPLGLLLDFDGTLSEIVPRPPDARMRPDAAAALVRLSADPRVSIAIVSGRHLDDLAARVAVPRAWLVGSHGGELREPTGARTLLVDPRHARPRIEAFLADVRAVALEAGLLVEDKGIAAAVHLRGLAADRVAEVTARVIRAAERLAQTGVVSWVEGKQVIELRARGATKAHAARELLARWPRGATLAVGDDVVDEDMFAEVDRRGGATIRVGPGVTCARARLEDPRAVAVFLTALAERERS